METPDTVGALLYRLRTSRNVSLGEVARRADISKSAISKWESGQHTPRPEILRLVLDALEADAQTRVSFAELFDRRDAWTALGLPAKGEIDHGCLADLLVGLRLRAGCSQRQVANALRVQQSTISRWECGDFEPTVATREALARIYRLSPEEFAVMESISNHDEPLVVRIQRSPHPLEAGDLFDPNHDWNDRSDILRLRAAVHQIRRRKSVDARWDELFITTGERLSSLYMATNRVAEWLPVSRSLRREMSRNSLKSHAGERIVMCNYLAHLRASPQPISTAKLLAENAGRLFPHEASWALVTAAAIATEHRETELALAYAIQTEEVISRGDHPPHIPGIIARYLRWAGLHEQALGVIGRWSHSLEAHNRSFPTDVHTSLFFFEAAGACAALGDVVGAADYEAQAERILAAGANANNPDTIATLRGFRTLPRRRV